jgi:mono/diheme cytochrome c family protein
MSRKNKKPFRSGSAPQGSAGKPQNSGTGSVSSPIAAVHEPEPVAERRPVPVFIILLLVLLVYLGDMYVMDHGADVMGKAGPFPHQVYYPQTTFEQLVEANPIDPVQEARRQGQLVFNTVCAACHQANGQGLAGQFPPLAGSEWVKAEGPNRIIRAVLNGLGGPITVSGAGFNNSMPPWKETLSDEQIANVLTFVRSEWGNAAPAVKPDQVKKVREQVASSSGPESEENLKNQPEKVE